MLVLEYYWPNNECPGYALRWTVQPYEAHVEVCTATGSIVDGKPAEYFVMSDGGCGDLMPLNGPWVREFAVAVKFDGYARMWCDDLQLGSIVEVYRWADVMRHIYVRAVVLMQETRAS